MKIVLDLLKGAVIGVANIVPGLSGGTMALIMGIYDRLTDAIGNIVTDKVRRKEYITFLIVILIGAVLGILLFAELFSWLLASPIREQHTYFFVTGLIIGSIPFILKIHPHMEPNSKRMILLLLGLFSVVGLTLISGQEKVTYNPEILSTWFGFINVTGLEIKYGLWLMVCGFITSSAMVLPGISGSALLVSLGEYGNVLAIVDKRLIIPAGFFGIGVILGVFICAKVIGIFLKKYTVETYYFIIGLMLASIYQITVMLQSVFNISAPALSGSVVALMIGFCISYFASQIEKK
jgi:putative membrane protein